METNTNNTPGEAADNSGLYAFGLLSAREISEFEADLIAGKVDADALEEHLQTMTALCEQIAQVMPTPRRAVKDAIMAAITAPEPAIKSGEQTFVLADDGAWVEMFPGIMAKLLNHATELGRTTILVRLAPGAAYPAHRHMGLEECLVLEGDLIVDGFHLGAGDFTASNIDKVHISTYSQEGCLLLISSPMNDEFLTGNGAHEH